METRLENELEVRNEAKIRGICCSCLELYGKSTSWLIDQSDVVIESQPRLRMENPGGGERNRGNEVSKWLNRCVKSLCFGAEQSPAVSSKPLYNVAVFDLRRPPSGVNNQAEKERRRKKRLIYRSTSRSIDVPSIVPHSRALLARSTKKEERPLARQHTSPRSVAADGRARPAVQRHELPHAVLLRLRRAIPSPD